MELEELTKPYREVCDGCHQVIVAYKSADGEIKYQCPFCGTVTVKRYKSKYHFTKDVRRPRH